MLKSLNTFRSLLLGGWVGAAIFFSATVAPAAFGVLRANQVPSSGEIAGAIVNISLRAVNVSGFVIAVVSLLCAFLLRDVYSRRAFAFQTVLLGLVALATGVGQWIIAARMHSLRLAMGRPMDQIPATDPDRMAFSALHGYSVVALSIAIIAGAIAFFVMARRKD